MRKIIAFIPNTITLLNLLSGTIAIIFAFGWNETYGQLQGWQWAALMIAMAAIFDFMDGAAARLLNARSPIGKELDSLADLVSFGVAPAMLLMSVMRQSEVAGLWAYAPLFIPLMGALRLAKFNIDDSQATVFKGLPIPANAIFWIGTVAAIATNQVNPPLNLLVLCIALVSLLMVSNLEMFSLKFHSFALRGNVARYFIILSAIALVSWLGLPGLAVTIVVYIVVSIVSAVVKISY
jgi:CDP-diacylglycerol--serine O-phosphatidyltransferase